MSTKENVIKNKKKQKQVNPIGYDDLFFFIFHSKKKKKKKVDDL